MNGVCPDECFLSRLAAFFSLGVSRDFFLDSLFVRWVLDMVLLLARNGRAWQAWISLQFITPTLVPTEYRPVS